MTEKTVARIAVALEEMVTLVDSSHGGPAGPDNPQPRGRQDK